MGSWSERVYYQGKAVNLGLRYIIDAANKMLANAVNGGEYEPLTIVQGSWSGASASAGTHSGSGAIDCTAYNWRNRERVFRLLGMAAWHRPTLPGTWNAHIHGITDGDGGVSASAARQVVAYHNRRNGLANNGPDEGYRMLVFPLFVFPEKAHGKPGTCWVATAGKTYSQPTASSTVKRTLTRGQTFTVVAVVNVNGTYWGINAAAECFPMVNLSRTPVPSTTTTTVQYPADIFGKDWKLTLPLDGPDSGTEADEVRQPRLATYSSTACRVASGGQVVVFTVRHGGATTSGSKNPRSELREMRPGGLDEISWDGRRGKHRMAVELSITYLTAVKPDVVVAQIHGGGDDVTTLRGEGVSGTDRIKMWISNGDTSHGFYVGEVRKGERFTFAFDVADGKVRFDFNGRRLPFTVPAPSGCYFKTGCYLQSNPSTAPNETSKSFAQVCLWAKPEVSHA